MKELLVSIRWSQLHPGKHRLCKDSICSLWPQEDNDGWLWSVQVRACGGLFRIAWAASLALDFPSVQMVPEQNVHCPRWGHAGLCPLSPLLLYGLNWCWLELEWEECVCLAPFSGLSFICFHSLLVACGWRGFVLPSIQKPQAASHQEPRSKSSLLTFTHFSHFLLHVYPQNVVSWDIGLVTITEIKQQWLNERRGTALVCKTGAAGLSKWVGCLCSTRSPGAPFLLSCCFTILHCLCDQRWLSPTTPPMSVPTKEENMHYKQIHLRKWSQPLLVMPHRSELTLLVMPSQRVGRSRVSSCRVTSFPNQAWVHSPTCSKAKLLTLGCGEGSIALL